MMRLTPLSLAANTIFYLILAVMYCRVLTRRFSWPFTLLGLTVGYLLYIIPTKFMPYADAERMLFGLVTFPLTPIVLFRDKWYKSLLCAFAGLVAMAGSDLLSVSWLLTPEQLRQGLHLPCSALQQSLKQGVPYRLLDKSCLLVHIQRPFPLDSISV